MSQSGGESVGDRNVVFVWMRRRAQGEVGSSSCHTSPNGKPWPSCPRERETTHTNWYALSLWLYCHIFLFLLLSRNFRTPPRLSAAVVTNSLFLSLPQHNINDDEQISFPPSRVGRVVVEDGLLQFNVPLLVVFEERRQQKANGEYCSAFSLSPPLCTRALFPTRIIFSIAVVRLRTLQSKPIMSAKARADWLKRLGKLLDGSLNRDKRRPSVDADASHVTCDGCSLQLISLAHFKTVDGQKDYCIACFAGASNALRKSLYFLGAPPRGRGLIDAMGAPMRRDYVSPSELDALRAYLRDHEDGGGKTAAAGPSPLQSPRRSTAIQAPTTVATAAELPLPAVDEERRSATTSTTKHTAATKKKKGSSAVDADEEAKRKRGRSPPPPPIVAPATTSPSRRAATSSPKSRGAGEPQQEKQAKKKTERGRAAGKKHARSPSPSSASSSSTDSESSSSSAAEATPRRGSRKKPAVRKPQAPRSLVTPAGATSRDSNNNNAASAKSDSQRKKKTAPPTAASPSLTAPSSLSDVSSAIIASTPVPAMSSPTTKGPAPSLPPATAMPLPPAAVPTPQPTAESPRPADATTSAGEGKRSSSRKKVGLISSQPKEVAAAPAVLIVTGNPPPRRSTAEDDEEEERLLLAAEPTAGSQRDTTVAAATAKMASALAAKEATAAVGKKKTGGAGGSPLAAEATSGGLSTAAIDPFAAPSSKDAKKKKGSTKEETAESTSSKTASDAPSGASRTPRSRRTAPITPSAAPPPVPIRHIVRSDTTTAIDANTNAVANFFRAFPCTTDLPKRPIPASSNTANDAHVVVLHRAASASTAPQEAAPPVTGDSPPPQMLSMIHGEAAVSSAASGELGGRFHALLSEGVRVTSVRVVPTVTHLVGTYISAVSSVSSNPGASTTLELLSLWHLPPPLAARSAVSNATAEGIAAGSSSSQPRFQLLFTILAGTDPIISHDWLPMPIHDRRVLGFISLMREKVIMSTLIPIVPKARVCSIALCGIAAVQSPQWLSTNPSATTTPGGSSDTQATALSPHVAPAAMQWVTDGARVDHTQLVIFYRCGTVVVLQPTTDSAARLIHLLPVIIVPSVLGQISRGAALSAQQLPACCAYSSDGTLLLLMGLGSRAALCEIRIVGAAGNLAAPSFTEPPACHASLTWVEEVNDVVTAVGFGHDNAMIGTQERGLLLTCALGDDGVAEGGVSRVCAADTYPVSIVWLGPSGGRDSNDDASGGGGSSFHIGTSKGDVILVKEGARRGRASSRPPNEASTVASLTSHTGSLAHLTFPAADAGPAAAASGRSASTSYSAHFVPPTLTRAAGPGHTSVRGGYFLPNFLEMYFWE